MGVEGLSFENDYLILAFSNCEIISCLCLGIVKFVQVILLSRGQLVTLELGKTSKHTNLPNTQTTDYRNFKHKKHVQALSAVGLFVASSYLILMIIYNIFTSKT